jgi:hypothetical protein
MKREHFDLQIAGHFLTALMYGDETGLNADDKQQLTEFLESFDGSIDVCLKTTDDDGNEIEPESFFGRCAICKLKADVYDVIVIETK